MGRKDVDVARGCAGGCDLTRREAMKVISTAAVAALVGVPLAEGSPAVIPVRDGAGTAATAGERSYPLPATDGVTIDKEAQVILVRFQGKAYAFNLACPHENTALRWRPKDGRFQCPRHESKYQPDGTFISGRATRHMDRLGVRLVGGQLLVDLNRFYRSDTQPAEWAAASVAL
jgi:Rieske Fe-S protein